MAKNTYYKNDAEKETLKALRDAFTFDAPPPSNLNIMIAGLQKSGKTHLLCTLAGPEYGPLYLLDTEQRAQLVTEKFDKKWVHRAIVRDYTELVAGMKYVIKTVKAPAIIAIDSGTDLEKYACDKYLADVGRERMGMPITYPEMYAYIYAVIDDLKNSGFTVVWTTKVKDEYVGDKSTGKLLPRIFKDLPYRADLVIQIREQDRVPYVLHNGLHDNQGIMLSRDMSLPQMIQAAREGK